MTARFAHQQQPQFVQFRLEVELAVEHRGPGDGTDATGDDARRHPLRVGVDRREVAGGSH